MSDIGIQFPVPMLIVLGGAIFWPITLTIAAIFAIIGVAVPRIWIRFTCLGLALLLGADCLLAIWIN